MISLHSPGIMLNTLVHNFLDDEGSKWVVFVPTVVFLYGHVGTPSIQAPFLTELTNSEPHEIYLAYCRVLIELAEE